MKRLRVNNFKVKQFFYCLMLAITFFGCSNEYIDEPSDTQGLPENVVFENRAIAESYINGIYAIYKGQYRTVDVGGLYAMYFARAVKGSNLVQGLNWFRFDYGHENREPNFRRTSFTWDFNYQIINYANILISGVQSSGTLSDIEKQEFIAVGKTIRAFHYFQLILEFCPNYNNDRTIARLPYYDTPVSLETVFGGPPEEAQFIMSKVLQDLNEAIPDLTESRPGKSYVNSQVANGILARVLSVTQDDWLALSNAAKAAYGGNASTAVVSTNWGNGFNNMQDDEWLWGHFQNGTSESNYYWGHPAAMMDHFTLSYQATFIPASFINMFSSTDVRNTFVANPAGASAVWNQYVSRKFSFAFDSDIPTMRKSEMVLLDAEAQYQLGNIPAAQNLLFALQSERDPNATASGNTGTALFEEILLERRKELYGEIGTEWFDAKRYNRSIVRGSDHRVQLTVSADSDLFFLKIPISEINNNPNFDQSINE